MFIRIIIYALGLVGALTLASQADAKAVSASQVTAVYQDFDGTPCHNIVKRGRLVKECHVNGRWQPRQACAGDELIAQRQAEHRPFIRLIPKPKRAPAVQVAPKQVAVARPVTPVSSAAMSSRDIADAARAAALAAADARRAEMEVTRPSVAFAFRGF